MATSKIFELMELINKAQKHAFLSFIWFFNELEIIYEANSNRFNKFLLVYFLIFFIPKNLKLVLFFVNLL